MAPTAIVPGRRVVVSVPQPERHRFEELERTARARIAHRRCLRCVEYGDEHRVLVVVDGSVIVLGVDGHRYDPGDRRLVDIGHDPERRAA